MNMVTLRLAASMMFLAVCAGCAAPGRRADVERLTWAEITSELLAMRDADQEIRQRFIAAEAEGKLRSELVSEMRALDRKHSAWLKEVVAVHGWPRRSQVGAEAAGAAWLLAQHADQDPAFQAQVLELLTPLVATGEVARPDYALLVDRVRVARGQPQVYGTQFLTVTRDGVTYHGLSTPVENPDQLDVRRAAMELSPHAEYDALVRRMYHIADDARPIEELPGRTPNPAR